MGGGSVRQVLVRRSSVRTPSARRLPAAADAAQRGPLASRCRSHNGRSHDGRAHDGRAHDGRAHDGRAHDGHSHDGHSHDGRSHDGGADRDQCRRSSAATGQGTNGGAVPHRSCPAHSAMKRRRPRWRDGTGRAAPFQAPPPRGTGASADDGSRADEAPLPQHCACPGRESACASPARSRPRNHAEPIDRNGPRLSHTAAAGRSAHGKSAASGPARQPQAAGRPFFCASAASFFSTASVPLRRASGPGQSRRNTTLKSGRTLA